MSTVAIGELCSTVSSETAAFGPGGGVFSGLRCRDALLLRLSPPNSPANQRRRACSFVLLS